jgi:hypothetical protein
MRYRNKDFLIFKIKAMKYLILFLFSIVFMGCQESVSPLDVDSSSIIGSWKVKSYIDNKGRDQTSNYNAYGFSFLENGALEARKNGTVTKGTYAYVSDSGKQKFIISLNSISSELEELNEDWIIIEKTAIQITLSNISGGNGGTSTLVFVK